MTPIPAPRLPLSLVVLACLLSDLSLAQADICKAGAKCASRDFTSTAKEGSGFCNQGPNASWAWATGSSGSTLGRHPAGTRCAGAETSLINLSVNNLVVASHASGGWRAGDLGFQAADGSLEQTSYSWSSDADTGLYRPAADTVAVATGGERSFQFTPTAGTLEGVTASSSLTLDSTGAQLTYEGTLFRLESGSALLSASKGLQFAASSVATSFNAGAKVLQPDSATGFLYWNRAGPSATSPTVDFGGGLHPVLERRTYALVPSAESSATPTYYPVAPSVSGASATVTPTDAATPGTSVVGTSPHQFDARVSNTAASAGSLSSLATTAFIRRGGSAPRWCQRLSLSSKSSARYWLGLANALPGATDNPANGHVSFRCSAAAGDSYWQACYGNGVGTTCVSTTKAPTIGTAAYDLLCIDCREGLSTACVWWVNGVATNRVTSGLPTGAPWFPYYSVEALSASARALYAGPLSVELY